MKKSVYFLLVLFFISFQIFYCQTKEASKECDLTDLAKEFVELLSKEDFSNAVKKFDEKMKKVMTPEKLQITWKSLISKIGPYKKQVDVRTEKDKQHDIVFVTCEFEKTTIDIKVVFNSEKQIAGLWFVPSQ